MKSSLPGSLTARIKWGSGSAEEVSAVDLFLTKIRTLEAQRNSSDPEIAAEASRLLEATAQAFFAEADIVDALQALAKRERESMQRAEAAKQPRPRARDPLRQKIVGAMRAPKRRGTEFKAFIADWELGDKRGLSLALKRGKFEVRDDDAKLRKSYALATLANIWSEAD